MNLLLVSDIQGGEPISASGHGGAGLHHRASPAARGGHTRVARAAGAVGEVQGAVVKRVARHSLRGLALRFQPSLSRRYPHLCAFAAQQQALLEAP